MIFFKISGYFVKRIVELFVQVINFAVNKGDAPSDKNFS